MVQLLDKLEKTNSIIDEIHERSQRTSSSIYPDLEKNFKISFRHIYLHSLLKSLVAFSEKSNNTVQLKTISTAINWIIELRKIVSLRQYWWSEPLVNIAESEIIFEWWHNTKKVTIYFSETNAEFIKVWGSDIDNEMEEGIAESSKQIEFLWQWLAS
jgi:hypothetical protein